MFKYTNFICVVLVGGGLVCGGLGGGLCSCDVLGSGCSGLGGGGGLDGSLGGV